MVRTLVDSVVSGALDAVAGLGVLVELVLGGVEDSRHVGVVV